jgi:hypothetical protein
MKKPILFIFILIFNNFIFGQYKKNDTISLNKNKTFNYKSLIIPTVLIGFGSIGLESDGIKKLNSNIQEIYNSRNKLKIDDYAQFTPFLAVYGLNAIGVKGENNFKDRTIILGTAYLTMGIIVNATKRLTGIERPDGSSKTAFPSGHTATAFMGAEFLYQEYKYESILYGTFGYLIASGTAFLRIYNNRHWFTDVVAGAGVGILSSKIAYWIHPWLKENIFKNKKDTNGVVMPFYNGKEYGLGLSLYF